MKQLKLGLMTSEEVATWFGIATKTYLNARRSKLEILADYCDFDEVFGGVEIKEIYIDAYDKNLNKRIDKMVLQEIKATNGLMSISGMAKKLGLSRYEERLATKSRIKMFGKFSEDNPMKAEGIFGYRKAVWAIKINDQDVYRKLLDEERDLWRQILDKFYNKKLNDDEVLLKVQIAEFCIENKCSFEEYNQMLADYGFDFYGLAVSKFKDQTGLQIVHISEHELEMGEARLSRRSGENSSVL